MPNGSSPPCAGGVACTGAGATALGPRPPRRSPPPPICGGGATAGAGAAGGDVCAGIAKASVSDVTGAGAVEKWSTTGAGAGGDVCASPRPPEGAANSLKRWSIGFVCAGTATGAGAA